MKLVLFICINVLLLVSCNTFSAKDEVIEFIPGTYVRHSQHEYGTEHDTLVITLQNSTAHEYNILRKWKYERVLDGSAMEPEYKRVTASGIYSKNNKVLQETESGDLFSFDVKGRCLFIGSTKYQKL